MPISYNILSKLDGNSKAYSDYLFGQVPTASGSSIAFTNGLTESGGTASLGGKLTSNAVIDCDYNSYSVVTANNYYTSAVGSSQMYTSYDGYTMTRVYGIPGSIYLQSTINAGSNSAYIFLNASGSSITDNGTNNTIQIIDEIYNKGVVYAGDYSSNFTPESLVSKRYVDSVSSVDSVTASIDADYTITGPSQLVTLAPISSNRTVTFPMASSYAGRSIRLINSNGSSMSWLFTTGSVYDALGVAVNAINSGATMCVESNGVNWIQMY